MLNLRFLSTHMTVKFGKITKNIRSFCRNTIKAIRTVIVLRNAYSRQDTSTLRIEQQLQIQIELETLRRLSSDELIEYCLFVRKQMYLRQNAYESIILNQLK